MKQFICYLPNGKITKVGVCQDSTFDIQALPTEYIIESTESGINQYVENGIVKNMPTKPDGDYYFDYESKEWVLDEQYTIFVALEKRNELLKNGPDRISPLWYDSMTDEQKQAWAKYRQDLLDVPSQPDFPNDIIWPIMPSIGVL